MKATTQKNIDLTEKELYALLLVTEKELYALLLGKKVKVSGSINNKKGVLTLSFKEVQE